MSDRWIIDFILALIAVEVVVLCAWRLRRGAGPSIIAIVANALAGAGLLLAFRSAFDESGGLLTGVFLLVALLAHMIDLFFRWRIPMPASGPHVIARAPSSTRL